MKQVKSSEIVANRSDARIKAQWEWYQTAYDMMLTAPGEWFELHTDTNFHAYGGQGRIAFDAMQRYHNPFLFKVRYPAIGHGVIYGRLTRGPKWIFNRIFKKESK